MKIAIYSRGGETVQQADWQLLLNELNKEKITTVIHENFFVAKFCDSESATRHRRG